MIERTDERKNKRTNGLIDHRTNKETNERTDKRTNGRTIERIKEQTDEQILNGRTKVRKDERTIGPTNCVMGEEGLILAASRTHPTFQSINRWSLKCHHLAFGHLEKI